jgi:hypothetical protein
MKKNFDNLKPTISEEVWVDSMDDDKDGESFEGCYGVFGLDSGFCYNYFDSQRQAEGLAEEMNQRREEGTKESQQTACAGERG